MKEDILRRIRSALGENGGAAGAKLHEASRSGQPATARSGADTDHRALASRFEAELKSIGGQFYAAASDDDARAYVLNLAAARSVQSAVGWNCGVIGDLGLDEALEHGGIAFTRDTGSEEFLRQCIDAGLGISGVDYALADSGTLVVLSGPGQARSVSLLPPVHVALVRPKQVLADLNDLFPMLKQREALNSAIAFITGPSRTADIEMTLVVGVHGPQQLHVVMLGFKD